MKDRNLIIRRFGWWIRFYLGSTAYSKRFFRWQFRGQTVVNKGATLKLIGERCIGVQWRRNEE